MNPNSFAGRLNPQNYTRSRFRAEGPGRPSWDFCSSTSRGEPYSGHRRITFWDLDKNKTKHKKTIKVKRSVVGN